MSFRAHSLERTSLVVRLWFAMYLPLLLLLSAGVNSQDISIDYHIMDRMPQWSLVVAGLRNGGTIFAGWRGDAKMALCGFARDSGGIGPNIFTPCTESTSNYGAWGTKQWRGTWASSASPTSPLTMSNGGRFRFLQVSVNEPSAGWGVPVATALWNDPNQSDRPMVCIRIRPMPMTMTIRSVVWTMDFEMACYDEAFVSRYYSVVSVSGDSYAASSTLSTVPSSWCPQPPNGGVGPLPLPPGITYQGPMGPEQIMSDVYKSTVTSGVQRTFFVNDWQGGANLRCTSTVSIGFATKDEMQYILAQAVLKNALTSIVQRVGYRANCISGSLLPMRMSVQMYDGPSGNLVAGTLTFSLSCTTTGAPGKCDSWLTNGSGLLGLLSLGVGPEAAPIVAAGSTIAQVSIKFACA